MLINDNLGFIYYITDVWMINREHDVISMLECVQFDEMFPMFWRYLYGKMLRIEIVVGF